MKSIDTITLCLTKNINSSYFKNSKFNWKYFINKNKCSIFFLDLNNCHFEYNCSYHLLRLTFSATKFLYTNNYSTLKASDIRNLIERLDVLIATIFDSSFSSITEWNITRLDIVSNYILSNSDDKKIYLDLLKKVSIPFCKTTFYDTSIHSKNKTRCYNIYDKNAQCPETTSEILRIEIQLKNSALYKLVKNKTFKNKTFGCIINSLDALNEIFKSHLIKLGLDKKFVTSSTMKKFLDSLYNKKIISYTKLNNMLDYFSNKKQISKNTLIDYKNILSKFNYSNILLDKKPSSTLNFMKFNLFSFTYKHYVCKSKLLFKILIIFILSITSLNFINFPLIKFFFHNTSPLLIFTNYIDDS